MMTSWAGAPPAAGTGPIHALHGQRAPTSAVARLRRVGDVSSRALWPTNNVKKPEAYGGSFRVNDYPAMIVTANHTEPVRRGDHGVHRQSVVSAGANGGVRSARWGGVQALPEDPERPSREFCCHQRLPDGPIRDPRQEDPRPAHAPKTPKSTDERAADRTEHPDPDATCGHGPSPQPAIECCPLDGGCPAAWPPNRRPAQCLAPGGRTQNHQF